LGFDDIYWSSLVRPRLTMVRQPAREIGMTAARVLINHVERRSVASGEHLLPTQLVIRDSCAAPAPIKSRRRVSRRRLPAA
jgi:LacI family transcriptional regulator